MLEEEKPKSTEELIKEIFELAKRPKEPADENIIIEKQPPKDYFGFTFLFPLKEENPLVQEGDLRKVYSSKTKTLPELLHEKPFTVSEDVESQIYKDDLEFIQGMHIVFGTEAAMIKRDTDPIRNRREPSQMEFEASIRKYRDFFRMDTLSLRDIPFRGNYLIVDIGHAHLPAVAYKLMQNGVDCNFVIGENTNSRFKEAVKYWARRYQDVKKAQKEVVGYATMLDAHREERFPEEMFPTPEQLAELGIKRVVFLTEARASPESYEPKGIMETNIREEGPVLRKYKESGLEVVAFGIDNRKND